jgi:hypothetical protein
MNLKVKDKVILTCDETDFENQEPRRDCINKIVTIKQIFYDDDNIDTFFVEENKYEWVPENILTRVPNNMTLQEKIDLVKQDILTRFPDCHHTIRILLWDDNTDMVECRHGDGEKLYMSRYYDNKLTYEEIDLRGRPNSMLIDEKGTEYFPMPYTDHSITSQDFKSWLQSIDDDQTELEDLHLEYLAEVKANKH